MNDDYFYLIIFFISLICGIILFSVGVATAQFGIDNTEIPRLIPVSSSSGGSSNTTLLNTFYLMLNGTNQASWTPTTTKVTNLNADLLDGYNTGTSGGVIPILSGNNIYSGTSTFSQYINMLDDDIIYLGSGQSVQLLYESATSEVHFEQLSAGQDLIMGFDQVNFGSQVVLGGHVVVPSGQDGNYNLGSGTERMGTIYSSSLSDGSTSLSTSSIAVKNLINTFTRSQIISSTNPWLQLTDTSASQEDYNISVDNSNFVIRNTADARDDLTINGTGNVFINNSLAIGKTSNTHQLEVANNISSDWIFAKLNNPYEWVNYTTAIVGTTNGTRYNQTINLDVVLSASSTFLVDCQLFTIANAGTIGEQLNITTTGSPTSVTWSYNTQVSATTRTSFQGTSTSENTFADTGSAGTSVRDIGFLKGYIVTSGSSSTLTFRLKSETDTNLVQVDAGSYCRYKRVG